MKYLSVCAGVCAATLAWKQLDWQCVGFSEIEAFPRAVLSHHYPEIPLYGDFTKIQTNDGPQVGPVDLLVGGTPCQSFSMAGLRGGLDDARGNLMLEYLKLAVRLGRPKLVWENVPGVLSSWSDDPDCEPQEDPDRPGYEIVRQRHDFGCFLRALRELGYGFAYRVLDAQYVRVDGLPYAVPQRRRRVFLVAYPGDWRGPAAVLSDRDSLFGNTPPRRETEKDVAGTIGGSTQSGGFRTTDLDNSGAFIAENDISGTVSAKWANGTGGPSGDECQNIVAFGSKDYGADASEDVSPTLRASTNRHSHENAGAPPAIAFTDKDNATDEVSPPVRTSPGSRAAIAFSMRGRDGENIPEAENDGIAPSLATGGGGSSHRFVASNWRVRRLTPLECERLMGMPDGYTAIPFKGKPVATDGHRYKAIGNSMAVNCMRWIGQRIDMVEALS